MDVRLVMQQIEDSKGLIISAMEELKKNAQRKRDSAQPQE